MSAAMTSQQEPSLPAAPSRRRVVRAAMVVSMAMAAVVFVALTLGDRPFAPASFIKTAEQRQCESRARTTRNDYQKACADAMKACLTNSCQGQRGGACRQTCKKVESACKAAAYDRMQIDIDACAHGKTAPQPVAVSAPAAPPPSPNATVAAPAKPKVDEPEVEVPHKLDYSKPFKYISNDYCVGKEGHSGHDDSHDGRGFICARALGKPGCKTKSQLKSLWCACCHCYVECGMSNTEWDVCRHDGTCDATPS